MTIRNEIRQLRFGFHPDDWNALVYVEGSRESGQKLTRSEIKERIHSRACDAVERLRLPFKEPNDDEVNYIFDSAKKVITDRDGPQSI